MKTGFFFLSGAYPVNMMILMIGLYMLTMIGVGFWASRHVNTAKDYNLAGQSVGLGLAVFSLFATWFGAETIMGSSAAVAEEGLSGSRADPFGYTVCLLLMGFLVAYQLRIRNYTTIGDFFRDRFSQKVEFMAVVVMLPTSLFWAATQMLAFGQIISSVTDLELTTALAIGVGMIAIYTVTGGLLADIVNDFLQGLVLIVGLVILMVFVIIQAGGLDAALSSIKPEQLSLVGEGETVLSSIDTWLVPVLGSLVAQEALSRLLSTRSAKIARTACVLGGGLYLVVGVIPVFIALVASHFDLGLEHRDQFMPELAQELLPPWVFVIFIGALIAAILSTVDSTLLTFSTLASNNLVFPYWKTATEKQKLLFNRFMTVVAAALALWIAAGGGNVSDLAEMSSSFGSAGLLVTFFAGLWLKRGGARTAGATLAVGIVMSIMCNYFIDMDAPFLTSIVIATLAYLAGMLVEKSKQAKIMSDRFHRI
jgi:SSS family transporter